MIPRLSNTRGGAVPKAERRPLAELLSREMRAAFANQAEPLFPFVDEQYRLWEASDKLAKHWQQLLHTRQALVGLRLEQHVSPKEWRAAAIARYEKLEQEQQELVAHWTKREEEQGTKLQALRNRLAAAVLQLLDPLPPPPPPPLPPAPAPVPASPTAPLPSSPGSPSSIWSWGAEQDDDDDEEDGQAGIHPFFSSVDVLHHILSYVGFGLGTKALAATCRSGRETFTTVISYASICFKSVFVVPPPLERCPRLTHLRIVQSALPPTPSWVRACLFPVAPRLVSLLLSVDQRALINTLLQVDWPSLECLHLDTAQALQHMAAHPRMQGSHVIFPQLRVLRFPQYFHEAAFAALVSMPHGCFPALRVLMNQFSEATLSLRVSAQLLPLVGGIIARAPDTEELHIECSDGWVSQPFFEQRLAQIVPTHFTRLRVLDLTLNVYYGWNLDALNAPLVLLRALTEAPQAAAPIQVLRLCLCSQWAAWDWADPPLRLCSLPSLRRLELSCQISQRALSSILGAAGPGLRELELNRKERGLGLLTLLGSYEQPPPFAWLSTLERLTLYSQPISNGALRAVDRAMGCLPALETLKVYSDPADAFLVLLMRQRERGGLARLQLVDFGYRCTKGAGLLLIAFIKAHGEGAARGLRFRHVTYYTSVSEALRRVLGETWVDG